MGKSITLRSFFIENDDLKSGTNELHKLLSIKLQGSVVQKRGMILNAEDKNQESDLIADYNIVPNNYVSGTVIRICPTEGLKSIPDIFLQKEKFAFNDLDSIQNGSKNVIKDHYYFLLNDIYLITNLLGNKTISRFESYINWYLEDVRNKKFFTFKPLTTPPPETKYSELQNVIVRDSLIPNIENINDKNGDKKRYLIPDNLLKLIIDDVPLLNEIKEKQILSASLLIKFTRPKKMTKKEYEKIMGAYMKPISDTEDIIFKTKNGTFKGSDILKTKIVQIELTDSGLISEKELMSEMEKFLNEIEN